MDIAKSIRHIYPQANPEVDFAVQDDGPAPVLRPGVDGLFRFSLRPLAEGETEEIEGTHYRMTVDYNRLTLGVDYDIVERGPYIAAWHLPHPQPTEQELQTAWNAIKDIPLESAHQTEAERVNTLEKENEILKTQNQALANRIELIEKLIAEKRL